MKVARYRSVVTSIDSAIGKVWQGKYLAEELEELKKLPIPTAAPALEKTLSHQAGIPDPFLASFGKAVS